MGNLSTNEHYAWTEDDYRISKLFLSFYANNETAKSLTTYTRIRLRSEQDTFITSVTANTIWMTTEYPGSPYINNIRMPGMSYRNVSTFPTDSQKNTDA